MFGDAIDSRVIKGLGAVSAAAPFPKVFCEFGGMEGFACEFTLIYKLNGKQCELPITPELYARLSGPYNRRNVYGAALAGGPKLPPPIWQAVFKHGFGSDGALRTEFGVPQNATNLHVLVQSKTQGRSETWTLAAENYSE